MKHHEGEITSKCTNKEEKKNKDDTTDIPYPIDQWEERGNKRRTKNQWEETRKQKKNEESPTNWIRIG